MTDNNPAPESGSDTAGEAEEQPLGSRLSGVFPKLDREDRQELSRRIYDGCDPGIDFVIMMFLSATLASLGLLQGSTAVVIGAMLVAPLMNPLIAAGLSIVQGNVQLIRRSFGVSLLGVGIGLGVSVFFGLINPGFEPSMELEARGNPDVLDLGVALASGMVAAYALSRPNVSNTLAGVAIAAALVPPLATVGIAATNGRAEVSLNALLLLTTNLVAIILGAALIFRLLGVHLAQKEMDTPIWVRRVVRGLILTVGVLSILLFVQGFEKIRTGQARPATYPVATKTLLATREYVDTYERLSLMAIGRQSIEPEASITVVVMAADTVPSGFRIGLINAIRGARGYSPLDEFADPEDELIDIFIVQEAETEFGRTLIPLQDKENLEP